MRNYYSYGAFFNAITITEALCYKSGEIFECFYASNVTTVKMFSFSVFQQLFLPKKYTPKKLFNTQHH